MAEDNNYAIHFNFFLQNRFLGSWGTINPFTNFKSWKKIPWNWVKRKNKSWMLPSLLFSTIFVILAVMCSYVSWLALITPGSSDPPSNFGTVVACKNALCYQYWCCLVDATLLANTVLLCSLNFCTVIADKNETPH